jgi:hypothetical protein
LGNDVSTNADSDPGADVLFQLLVFGAHLFAVEPHVVVEFSQTYEKWVANTRPPLLA